MGPGSDGFADMLDATIRAADDMRKAGAGAAEPVSIRSANGRVEVEIGADGRLTCLVLDPEWARTSTERLAAAIVEAVNEGLAEQQRQRGLIATGVDLSQMTAQLRQIQNSAVPQMRTFLAGVTAAQADAAERARR